MSEERYRLHRRIKAGGAAEVFQASLMGASGFERPVAIKKLLPESARQPAFQKSFIDEARIAAQLRHRNIVSVLDFGVLDGQPFIALELVDGFDLVEAIERAEQHASLMELGLAAFVTSEVAQALAYAHRAKDAQGRPMKLVHRDVSPENVLLSTEGDVLLTDFGIAHAAQRLEVTLAGITKGKPSYIAPEQLRGDRVDHRADLFGLGCVLHFLLTGRSPAEGRSGQAAQRGGRS